MFKRSDCPQGPGLSSEGGKQAGKKVAAERGKRRSPPSFRITMTRCRTKRLGVQTEPAEGGQFREGMSLEEYMMGARRREAASRVSAGEESGSCRGVEVCFDINEIREEAEEEEESLRVRMPGFKLPPGPPPRKKGKSVAVAGYGSIRACPERTYRPAPSSRRHELCRIYLEGTSARSGKRNLTLLSTSMQAS